MGCCSVIIHCYLQGILYRVWVSGVITMNRASEHKGDLELQDLRNKLVGRVKENIEEDLNKKDWS